MITNGTRLTTDLVAQFASLRLPLSISLDTLDRARYRQIRGADQLSHVLAGLDLLAQYPFPKFLTCIVSEVNRDEVPDVVRFARSRGFIPVVGAYHWKVGLYGKEDPGLMYDRSAAIRVFEQLLNQDLIPVGYFRQFVKDSVVWLSGQRLEPCDAGRYSIAIDASGNVSPCLALSPAGNLRESPYREILSRFDRTQIQACSDCSSCNRLDGRVVGTIMRHPITAWRTPVRLNRKRGTMRRFLTRSAATVLIVGCSAAPTSFTPSHPVPSESSFPRVWQELLGRMSMTGWLTIRRSLGRIRSRPIWRS